MGADVFGRIGDASIADAVGDALREKPFDEVILVTPPTNLVEHLIGDLGSRVKRIGDVLVTHVIVPDARRA